MVLYTNANGVLNDDKYEYDLGYAVAADVAEAVAKALWCQSAPSSGEFQIDLFPAGWNQQALGAIPVCRVETPSHIDEGIVNGTDQKQTDILSCYKYFLDS